MNPDSSYPEPDTPESRPEFVFGAVVYISTALIFAPMARWLVSQTLEHRQLLHALVVLLLAGFALIYERRERMKPVWTFNLTARYLLLGAYALLIPVILLKQTIWMLPSFSCTLASLALFVFGERFKRFVFSIFGAFMLFTLLTVFLPVLDWPLRTFAGVGSAKLLTLIGLDVQLGVTQADSSPMLLLVANKHPFHVAPECNGFGVLTASLLLALLLVLFQKIHWSLKVGAFTAAFPIAYLFNLIRIIVIILLAPVIGFERYHLMHETVGIICYYGCLLGIWWAIRKLPTKQRSSATPSK